VSSPPRAPRSWSPAATVPAPSGSSRRSPRAADGPSRSVDLAGAPDDIRAFATEATALLGGRVDVLVNNAGVYPVGPTDALTDADLDAVLATNVRAPHVLVGALAPAMAARGDGAVVNIGSWMSRVGIRWARRTPRARPPSSR